MILFDLVATQGKVNGGAEYAKRVFREVASKAGSRLECLYESTMPLPEGVARICSERGIPLHDLRKIDVVELCRINSYERFFLPIIQRYYWLDFEEISCPVILTWHDVRELEIQSFRRKFWERRFRSRTGLMKTALKVLLMPFKADNDFYAYKAGYSNIARLCGRTTTTIIADSSHTKHTIRYFFPEISPGRIKVLFPPEKNSAGKSSVVEDPILRGLIQEGRKFVLLISCDRPEKNAGLFLSQFDRFISENPDFCCLLVGHLDKGDWQLLRSREGVHNVGYLSPGDLEAAYEHAYCLVYPTLQEGFGYPPLEAMKYGTPVIASAATSLPEVLGDSALAICPFYEFELFARLMVLINDRDSFSREARTRYDMIRARQEADLASTVSLIVDGV